ncbi:MAG: tRNA (adenosine(37)-N6)-threonylcarbamoyltransferase complex dimerization subunit type 1 TsaB [Pirellula sp.]|nr:tRNA (adenosine(37)-N6)-threonylcarbamoyltransferase complex dimerization subunit type 1 TsaB [Pirellula sp.]
MTTNLLALETSGRSGSIALAKSTESLDGLRESIGSDWSLPGRCLRNLTERLEILSLDLDPTWGSAKTLAPAIQKLLAQDGLAPKDLHAIAVVQGPGSFTGLRVGIATAKVMAYALQIPIVAIDTLEVIAQQVSDSRTASDSRSEPGSQSLDLFAVADAFRGQSFWAKYRIGAGECVETTRTRIDDNTWLAQELSAQKLTAQDPSGCIGVAGPSLEKLRDCYREIPSAESQTALDKSRLVWEPKQLGEPRASTVARLGWRAWLRDQTVEPFGLLPMYYRSSAAEEKHSSGPS